VKKNLLATAAVVSMIAAILCVGFAGLQGVIVYHVATTGMFHGEEYPEGTTIFIGVCSLWVGVAMYYVSLGLGRIGARVQRGGQHPKSTIRESDNDD
jgi:hypothetical protein